MLTVYWTKSWICLCPVGNWQTRLWYPHHCSWTRAERRNTLCLRQNPGEYPSKTQSRIHTIHSSTSASTEAPDSWGVYYEVRINGVVNHSELKVWVSFKKVAFKWLNHHGNLPWTRNLVWRRFKILWKCNIFNTFLLFTAYKAGYRVSARRTCFICTSCTEGAVCNKKNLNYFTPLCTKSPH